MTICRENGINKIDRFFFWFCVIDVFFAPYFYYITVCYSLPLVFVWFIMRNGRALAGKREILLMMILLTMGTVLGLLSSPMYISDNISCYIQYMQMLMYYLLFYYYMSRNIINVEKVIFVFSIFVFVCVLTYFISFDMYVGIRSVFAHRFYMPGMDIYTGYRFGFIWADENNIAYVMCAVFMFYQALSNKKMIHELFILMTTILVLIASASTGGIIAFLFAWLVKIMLSIKLTRKLKINLGLSGLGVLILLTIVIIGLCIFGTSFLQKFNFNEIWEMTKYRVQQKMSAGGDSRGEIWKMFLSKKPIYYYLICGTGARTTLDGIYRSTHNGVLYFIYAYGMVFLVLFVKCFFIPRKDIPIKKQVYLVPLFIGFFMNIMFEEVKISSIFMFMIVACACYFKTRECEEIE